MFYNKYKIVSGGLRTLTTHKSKKVTIKQAFLKLSSIKYLINKNSMEDVA